MWFKNLLKSLVKNWASYQSPIKSLAGRKLIFSQYIFTVYDPVDQWPQFYHTLCLPIINDKQQMTFLSYSETGWVNHFWAFNPSASITITVWLLFVGGVIPRVMCCALYPRRSAEVDPPTVPSPSAPPAVLCGRTCIKRGKSVQWRGRDTERLHAAEEGSEAPQAAHPLDI